MGVLMVGGRGSPVLVSVATSLLAIVHGSWKRRSYLDIHVKNDTRASPTSPSDRLSTKSCNACVHTWTRAGGQQRDMRQFFHKKVK